MFAAAFSPDGNGSSAAGTTANGQYFVRLWTSPRALLSRFVGGRAGIARRVFARPEAPTGGGDDDLRLWVETEGSAKFRRMATASAASLSPDGRRRRRGRRAGSTTRPPEWNGAIDQKASALHFSADGVPTAAVNGGPPLGPVDRPAARAAGRGDSGVDQVIAAPPTAVPSSPAGRTARPRWNARTAAWSANAKATWQRGSPSALTTAIRLAGRRRKREIHGAAQLQRDHHRQPPTTLRPGCDKSMITSPAFNGDAQALWFAPTQDAHHD